MLQDNLSSQTEFLKQLAEVYNGQIGRPGDAVVAKEHLIAWLDSRTDERGLSVLETQILLHRDDVRGSVLEQGEINASSLRLWMITYGARELGLDREILAGTVRSALSLKKEGENQAYYSVNKVNMEYTIPQAAARLSQMLREQRVA